MTYEYAARLVRVVDGDTLDLDVDLGFRTHVFERFRLLGYAAPETREPGGAAATAALRDRVGGALIVRTHKPDSFGRWLADVFVDGQSVVLELIAGGYGKPWDGRAPKPRFP